MLVLEIVLGTVIARVVVIVLEQALCARSLDNENEYEHEHEDAGVGLHWSDNGPMRRLTFMPGHGMEGLSRFIAVCLLAGHAWLAAVATARRGRTEPTARGAA